VSAYRNHSGIILRRHVYAGKSEGQDAILTVFSPAGKFKAVAKSVTKGPRAGKLQLFQHLTFQTYQKGQRALPVLTQVVIEGALVGLTEARRYGYAHLLSELTDLLYQEGDRVGQLPYELFAGGLRGLVSHSDPDRVALLIAWKLLAASGLMPRLDVCVHSGVVADLTRFDPRAGGAVSGEIEQGVIVGAAPLAALALWLHHTVRDALADPLGDEVRAQLWQMLEAYVAEHVGRLRSWESLRAF
jgi:DNA repair protein RecO (recombination protein O)